MNVLSAIGRRTFGYRTLKWLQKKIARDRSSNVLQWRSLSNVRRSITRDLFP